MNEFENYLRLYSKWKSIKKDPCTLKFLGKEDLEKYFKKLEEYENEVINAEIYENEKKILLDLIDDYKKNLLNKKGMFESLDAIDILFLISSFSAAGVISLALERYLEKVEKNESFKTV